MSDDSNIKQSNQFSTFKGTGLQLPAPSVEVSSEPQSPSSPSSSKEENKNLEHLTDHGRLSVQETAQNDHQVYRKLSQRKKISSFVKRALSAKNSVELDDKKMEKSPAKQVLSREELHMLQMNLCKHLSALHAGVLFCESCSLSLVAVETIETPMKFITEDARKLSRSMDSEQRVALLDQVRDLCEATKKICDHINNTKMLPPIDCWSVMLPAVIQMYNASAQLESHLLPAMQEKNLQSIKQQLKKQIELEATTFSLEEEPEKRYHRILVSSAVKAKESLIATRQLLDEPITFKLLKEKDIEGIQQEFHHRLADLSVHVAFISDNTVRNDLDITKAINAIKAIDNRTPLVLKDGRKLCATKTGTGQTTLMENIKMLCNNITDIYSQIQNPQGLTAAANTFRETTKKLVALTNASPDYAKEQKITILTSHIHKHACTLSDQYRQIAQKLNTKTASELVTRGLDIVDAANRLTAVAQVLAPVLRDLNSCHELLCAVTNIRHVSAAPDIINKLPKPLQQTLQTYRQQLRSVLDQLVGVCYKGQDAGEEPVTISADIKDSETNFKKSASEAISTFQVIEMQMKQPLLVLPLPKEDVKPIKERLEDRCSRLDAAVNVLNEAAANENPNYANADEAIKNITNLMPLIIKDAHKLAATDKNSKSLIEVVDAKYKSVKSLVRGISTPNERTEELVTKPETVSKENIKMPNIVMSELVLKINKGNKDMKNTEQPIDELTNNISKSNSKTDLVIQKEPTNTEDNTTKTDTDDKSAMKINRNKMPNMVMMELQNKIKTGNEATKKIDQFVEDVTDNANKDNEKELVIHKETTKTADESPSRTETEDQLAKKTNKEKMPNTVMLELLNKIKTDSLETGELEREHKPQEKTDEVNNIAIYQDKANKIPDNNANLITVAARDNAIKENEDKKPKLVLCEMTSKLNTALSKLQLKSPEAKLTTADQIELQNDQTVQLKSPEAILTPTDQIEKTMNIVAISEPVYKKELTITNTEPKNNEVISKTKDNSTDNEPNYIKQMIFEVGEVLYCKTAEPEIGHIETIKESKTNMKPDKLNFKVNATDIEAKEPSFHKLNDNNSNDSKYEVFDVKPVSKLDTDSYKHNTDNYDINIKATKPKLPKKPISPQNDILINKMFNDRLTEIKDKHAEAVRNKVTNALKEAGSHLLIAKNSVQELVSQSIANPGPQGSLDNLIAFLDKSPNMEKITEEVENLEKLLQELKQAIKRETF